ncbi:hypothetical protein [Ohtaekwangia koreensis]|uniref:Uncharacterized protein n=1 Tax=Ohtaekwangia koreensis TaxID=688867 RepID=A0A1T5ITN9_9BACT|nr:hypothetical protein [Ohtaekwangia koreensis]SKC42506.1 hypothetical protein SAMN05660236_0387 [Ohtaekwangia koreensis]
MIKLNLAIQICISFLFVTLISCKDSQIKKIQGVFVADKKSLMKITQEKTGTENAFASALLNKVVENAVIEFKISGDSIKGIMFLAGQTNSINSKIETRNDSLFIKSEDADVYIVPNEKGFLFKNIQMIKSNQEDLSVDTKNMLTDLIEKQNELKEFTENLGQWQKGNFVDEFGDKTGEGFPFTVVSGSHETSTVVNSDVYVKSIINGHGIYFEIYNSTLSFKENFPDSEFGTIKIKFPSGDVKSERVFFFKNTVSESPDDKNPLIYNHLVGNGNGELKILIDLSTASSYQSDKYQFTLQKRNLDQVLSGMKGK